MIKIYLFSDTHKHFQSAICEYEKRLGREISVIQLKPSKRKEEKEIILEETLVLQEKLQKEKWYKILLYITGNMFSTPDFFKFIEDKKQHFWDIIFIVWWAYGVDFSLLEKNIDLTLSFSEFTFPHGMAYLLLLEQLYRISMIKKWTWYHH